ncbi:MAG: hypothetical protein ABEK04_04835 [Candidatus Nanohalobium sp.]
MSLFSVSMYGFGESWSSEEDWENIRDSLTETDTETVKEQLEHMDGAEITYPQSESGTEEIQGDLAGRYDKLIEFNSGSQGVTQYMEIDGRDLRVAVEKNDDLKFYLEAYEEAESKLSGLNLGLGTPS